MEPNDKKLEAFVDKLMANDVLETPSVDFKKTILDRLEVKSTTIVYKPLIPKWLWITLLLSFGILVVYALLNQGESTSRFSEFLSKYQLQFNNPLGNLNFNFSEKLMYSMLVLVVMIGLQVSLVKTYFNRKFQY